MARWWKWWAHLNDRRKEIYALKTTLMLSSKKSQGRSYTIICANKSIMSDVDKVRLVTRNVWATFFLLSWEDTKWRKEHTLVTPLSTNLMLLKIIKPTKSRLICRVTAARFSYWAPVASCDEDKWVNRKKSKSVRRSGYVDESEDRLAGRKITLCMDFTMRWVLERQPYGEAHLRWWFGWYSILRKACQTHCTPFP